ncbi:hypothetical protein [Streptomyces sp. NPDC001978]|uniref:hypothetical protein n=1 Tax=Streptomyces sp. NPDC001978 TaxID=3364627 RepID=UPI0036904F51
MSKVRKAGIIGAFPVLLALWSSPAMAAQVLDVDFSKQAAPNGTHFVTGTPTPTCTVSATQDVTCPTTTFELAGVGNTNATADLAADFTATVDCFNPGKNPNNPVESHTQTVTRPATSGDISPKNGRLTVNPITATAPTADEFQAEATCPNRHWTPVLHPGSINLHSFTYTLTFDGFNKPAITITGP